MADLDDFFAKKDRKKSKTVKKFTTADELAKKIDDPKQKVETRPKRERTEGEDGVRRDEDEWREYEETIKDYTGLKIQPLTGGAAGSGVGGGGSGGGSGGGETGGEDEGEDSGDGATRPSHKQKGPWNKSDGAPVPEKKPQQPPVEIREPQPPKEPPAPKPNQYVAPHLRNKPAPEMERKPMNKRQTRHAPDIHNDDYFPVLGAPSKNRPGVSAGGWSTAGGGSGTPAPTHAPQRVSTENRFTQLTNDS